MHARNWGLWAAIGLALLILPPPTSAQTSMGGVSGTVTDSAGGVVPGATVTLISQGTNVQSERVTNASGYFVFPNVRPGTYVLKVSLEGFRAVEMAPFTVGVNETLARDVTLEVGEITETVQVVGQSELLQSSTAELGNVLEEKIIRELPIQGRNFTQLLLLTPGVNPVSTAQGSKDSLGFGTEGNSGLPNSEIANASIQGQQNRSKIYYMDGIVNTSMRAGTYVALPDLDSMQEFKVQSHSDKAEFGGVTGGVINMTSKSGGNQFGGGAFGNFRNEAFVARDPFRDVGADGPLEVPEFRQYVYGAQFHGPIVKDKTFFFASYDGWRYRDFVDIRLTVPGAGELNGDFSQTFSGRGIYDPATTRIENGVEVRDPFPGNVIPADRIDPAMQAFFNAYLPRPNRPGNVANNFQDRRERTSESNAFQLRVDHYFSDSDNVFLRYTQRNIDNFQPEGDRSWRAPESVNRNFGGGWFHSFSPSVILELRGGYTNQVTQDAPWQHELGLAPQQGLGLPNLEQYGGYIATDESPWSWQDLGVQGTRPRENPNWNIAADLTWLKGKHNFKAGFQMLEISRLQQNQFGQLRFSTNQTANPLNTGSTGDSLASALLGYPDRIQAFVPQYGSIDFKTATISGYIQDQWAIKPNLTLTYGVRYDYITKAKGAPGTFQSGPDLDTGEWLIALTSLPGVCNPDGSTPPPCLPAPLSEIPHGDAIRATGEEASILAPIRDNIGPRVGLAWQINPRTVLRTGYSLMWDSMVSRSQYGQHQFESWGWPQFSGIDTGALNQISDGTNLIKATDGDLKFGLPAPQPWNAGGWFNDPDRKNAYSHQWHVEVQREITRDLMVSAGYVGSKNGRMEYSGYAAAPGVPAIAPDGRRLTSAERDQLRPWPYMGQGNFRYEQSIGDASYHALQVKVQRRFAHGLAGVLSYTLSRTRDTSSGWFAAESGIDGRNSDVQNYYDMDDARGISSYDIPHILTFGGIWELPGSGVLGGWQLNWNLIARSGQPFHITASGDPANIGVGSERQRADQVGDPSLANPNEQMWFNTAAFVSPVNNFGNMERNSLRAPAYWNVDLGLQKNVGLGTQGTLQLRIDVFNVFNHINLGDPHTRMAQGTYGTIDSMRRFPRQLEFGARIIF